MPSCETNRKESKLEAITGDPHITLLISFPDEVPVSEDVRAHIPIKSKASIAMRHQRIQQLIRKRSRSPKNPARNVQM